MLKNEKIATTFALYNGITQNTTNLQCQIPHKYLACTNHKKFNQETTK
jgi:hypothetical protein